ncbi:class I adenylate-forming enzyme family protein [Kitasatospora phosalacinea]|uniref:Class I adenylate-forming enzyme family protein n=1 Tax=Kitasatospora phosalacinea TaxID=2065 RepID=A0ABW6GRZ3_9ACTN
MTAPWPTGMPRSLTYPAGSVADLLAGSAAVHGERTALVDGDLRISFAELHERALRTAQGLREHGVRPGDVVALHLPNSAWFTVAYYGTLLAGATMAALNPALPPAALSSQLADIGATAAFTHPSCAGQLAEAAGGRLRLAVLVEPTAAAPAPAVAAGVPERLAEQVVPLAELLTRVPAPATPVGPEDVAHLAFTGGTTGRPKAIRVLHRNLLANVLQMACWRSAAVPRTDAAGRITLQRVPGADARFAVPLGGATVVAIAPMFHAMGTVTQNLFVASGVTAVVFGRFDPARYLDAVERHGAHTITGSPSLFHSLLAAPGIRERDLGSVRLLSSGAAPLEPATMDELRQVFPNALVMEAYGLSEATQGLVFPPLEQGAGTPRGSVGVPLFDTEVELRGPDGRTPVEPGGTGELWARGPQVTGGYLDQPALTAEQFADGWLRTGDLARRDEDGWYFLVGRAKDMLIYKGYNVYPGPLEALLCEHPAVAQATVVGLPDASAGELPAAYVVLHAGAAATPELAEQLKAHVAAHVAPYQRVRHLEFLPELPVSPAGKILKRVLRERGRGAGA